MTTTTVIVAFFNVSRLLMAHCYCHLLPVFTFSVHSLLCLVISYLLCICKTHAI
jgi:hypothetical protein